MSPVPPRRLFNRQDHNPLPGRAAEQPVPATEAARVLALQRSAGNAAVARVMAAGTQQVAREDDGYMTGATAQDTDDSLFDESSEEEAEETLDPAAQLAAAVAARVEDTGRAADPPPLPTGSDVLRGTGDTGADAYSEPEAYHVDGEGSEDESELSEDEPAAPPTAATERLVVVDDHYATQPEQDPDHYATQPDQDADSSESISEDEPASVPAAPTSGGRHDQYSAHPDEDSSSDSSSESSLSEDLPAHTTYTLPPDEEAPASAAAATEPAVVYAAPPKKKGRARRALEAVARPVKAAGKAIKKLGGRIKGAFKGKKGRKGKVTAADLLADGYAGQPVEEAPAAPAAVKYTAAQLRASGSAHPLAASVQGLPVEAQADEVSFSEDLAAPPPIKYTKLAKTNTDVMEEYDSADFLNNKLLAHNALAVDIRRHGLVAKSKSLDAIMADRALVKMGLKRVWGWTDEDIAKYFDFGTNRAKQSKVTFIRDEADLKKFVVHAGASMTYGDPPQPFDTGPMVSKASGPGFAIFVMDGAGNIYAGQHRVGLFHHSSFLAGRDVAAAGELKVSAGKLEVMTSKSGHYTPDAEQTWQAVKEMAALGVSFAGAEVRVWGQNKTDVYGGEEFLRRGAQAKIVRTEGRF